MINTPSSSSNKAFKVKRVTFLSPSTISPSTQDPASSHSPTHSKHLIDNMPLPLIISYNSPSNHTSPKNQNSPIHFGQPLSQSRDQNDSKLSVSRNEVLKPILK